MDDGPEIRTPGGHTIFCEDIRTEFDGRNTLIGVYRHLIGLPTFPAILPKLGVAITYRQPNELPPLPVKVRLISEPADGDQVTLAEVELDMPGMRDQPALQDRWTVVDTALLISPFKVDGPGHLKVRAYTEGRDTVRLGRLQILTSAEIDRLNGVVQA